MESLRILVVESDASSRDLLVSILNDDGYAVSSVPDGSTALATAEAFHPDLALISGLVAGGDGVDVARRLRQVGNLPIIFVTAADSAKDIYDGFRMGADDYIVKPFDPEELSWRVRAVLRRSGHAVAQVREFGDLVVDEGTRLVTRAGSPVFLTDTEFRVLGVLLRNRSRVVPKGQLVSQVWGYETDDHVLEVHMSSLRRKLETHGPRIIQTIRGTGYVLRL